MAHAQLDFDLDSNFEPQQRARSNTWPLPRPENYVEIKEEACDVDSLCHGNGAPTSGIVGAVCVGMGVPMDSMKLLEGSCVGGVGASAAAAAAAAKKNSSRRNAWGNMSYADLITQAIQSSPDKRLTLSQIYDWMVQNVPYFKDKGDSNSSAGWKNSIRHNLSLHNRFMRVQNEGTGKSSWWMINPDAKPGKSARRRATSMETSKYEKKRGRVKKKVEALRAGLVATPSPSSSVSEGLDMFPESPQLHHSLAHSHGGLAHYQLQQLSPGDFRPRASSNASSIGRLSPIPAVPESEVQDNPWSPQDYGSANDAYGSAAGGATDRFNPDQLVDNIAESMKIRENGFLAPSSAPPSAANGSNSVANSQPRQQQQSPSAASGSGGGSNGYGVCHAASYASPYSGQQPSQAQDYNPLGLPSNSSSSTSSSRTISSGLGRSPQHQRILNGPAEVTNAPPPYSMVALQGLSPSQNLHSLSPPQLQQLDAQQQRQNNCNNALANVGYAAPAGLPVVGRFCASSSQGGLVNLASATNCNAMGHSGSDLLRAALAQGSSSADHSPSPPERNRHDSATTPTPSQVMSHLMGVLNNNGVVSGLMPNDLDLNLDSLQGGFEDCNVDEVIKHELSMDGSLDFNFTQHQQLMQQQQQQQHNHQQHYQLGLQQQHHHHYMQQHHLSHHANQPSVNNVDFDNLAHFAPSPSSVPATGGSLSSSVSSQAPPLCSLAALAPGRSWEDF